MIGAAIRRVEDARLLTGQGMFLDDITIYVKGGDGGDGCMAFRKEFKTPKGGLRLKPVIFACTFVMACDGDNPA